MGRFLLGAPLFMEEKLKTKRFRDAGSGKIVSKEEAKLRPKETVGESGDLEDRVAALEALGRQLKKAAVMGQAFAAKTFSD